MKVLTTTTTIAAAAVTSLLLAACAWSPMTAPTMAAKEIAVPPAIKAADNEKLAFIWSAIGTQNYECKANANAVMAWAFVAPEAILYADKANIGSHGAGPYWAALDGSKIVGTVKARADAPSNKDIPWLILTTQSTGSAGKLAKVRSIQRVNTVGGVAASTGCTTAADAGKQSKVAYTADYAYYVAQ